MAQQKNELYQKPTTNLDRSVFISKFTGKINPVERIMFERRPDNYQPNVITRSRQEFSAIERKMLLFCINQIDHEAITKGVNLIFKIPTAEFSSNYTEIREACETIMSKKVRLIDNGKEYHAFVPFPEVKYYTELGKTFVEITMLSSSANYFLELKNQYTKYSLDVMLRMKSVTTQRIYEIIQLHVGRKEFEFEYNIEQLQYLLNTNFNEYFDFKRRVLNPALATIKKEAKINIAFAPAHKKGKKVVSLLFKVSELNKAAIEEEKKAFQNLDTNQVFLECSYRLSNYSFTKAQQNNIMADLDLMNIFLEIDAQFRHGLLPHVKNPTAYIAQSLGFGKKKSAAPN
jgi:plasmid replication initiation protein